VAGAAAALVLAWLVAAPLALARPVLPLAEDDAELPHAAASMTVAAAKAATR
jgi:hypothetical protein